MKSLLYSVLSTFYPVSYKKHFEQMLVYAGDSVGVRYWLGSGLLLSLLVFGIFLLYPLAVFRSFQWWFVLYGVLGFFAMQFLLYLLIYFKVEKRKERVEKALPDFLQLMAANLRAGMTPFQALRLSLRDEFGPLKEELQVAMNRALGTDNFTQVLLQTRERIPSPLFERTMELLTSSLRAGGKLSSLLEDLAKDVIETRTLRKELLTSTRTYGMFVLFTILLGAPLLFAISTYFLGVMISLQASTGVAANSSLVGEILITQDFFTLVACIFLVLTSFLACVLIGVIRTGEYFYGLRYAPFVASGALLFFYLFRILIGSFLG